MVDVSDKGSNCEEDMMKMKMRSPEPDRCGSLSSDGGSHSTSSIKTCADCGTTKTPLWRGGPAGPKSLCNACGIRSRKRRGALLGLSKEEKKLKKTAAAATSTSGGDSQTSALTTNNMGVFCLKRKLMPLGTEVVLQRPRSSITKQRRKIGEVEQAALLLMAISCGSIYD
ncbi:GATA transcription factor 16-like [Bidens hawaiensis]|uniref:GATA transcription factor 16-like n=1 Tax=Bidens hawaiensis TaxID=980011 RepID=UPI004049C2CA